MIFMLLYLEVMVNSMAKKGLTDKQIQQDKTDKIMNIVAERAGYYRYNPQRWVEDFIPDFDLTGV